MPQFDVTFFSSQIFWLFLVFGFLYILVSKVIAPAAESILTSRHRVMSDNIDEAEKFNEKSAELNKFKTDCLNETNKMAENIRASALKNLNTNFEARRMEVNEELKLKTDRAMRELQVFADSFHGQESEPCMKLAANIIEKVTGKPADKKILKEIEDEIT